MLDVWFVWRWSQRWGLSTGGNALVFGGRVDGAQVVVRFRW